MSEYQQISGSELEIMQIIWANNGTALFSDIMLELELKSKARKTNTVLTFLSRLVDKEMLAVKKRGRLNEYIAQITESEYMTIQTRTFLDRVYRGNAKNLISTLVKQDFITPEDFEELNGFWSGGKDIK